MLQVATFPSGADTVVAVWLRLCGARRQRIPLVNADPGLAEKESAAELEHRPAERARRTSALRHQRRQVERPVRRDRGDERRIQSDRVRLRRLVRQPTRPAAALGRDQPAEGPVRPGAPFTRAPDTSLELVRSSRIDRGGAGARVRGLPPQACRMRSPAVQRTRAAVAPRFLPSTTNTADG